MTPSVSHLVVIPSYNTGAKLIETVISARAAWTPVWVVFDGSTDGTPAIIEEMAESDPGMRVLQLPRNCGKGSAVLYAASKALAEGFTHMLTMDADGQHPPDKIAEFMAMSEAHPGALILGKPVFDNSAPALRVGGRKLSNMWADVETLWIGIGDSLFGFRVYPIAPLVEVMKGGRWMRRFDFDPEAAVRLCWKGVLPINIAAPVKYFTAAEGGVSHFKYLRDNVLLTWMHARLLLGGFFRIPLMLWRHTQRSKPANTR